MKHTQLHRLLLVSVMVIGVVLAGCEDPVPTDDYTPQIVVTAILFVGQPINDIRVHRSQSLTDTFELSSASIKNATVVIETSSTSIPCEFVDDSTGGSYRAMDTTYLVEPQTTYTLRMTADGNSITGVTTTPIAFAFVIPPRDTLVYPGKDKETELYDSLFVTWTPVAPGQEYVPGIINRDTTNYGIYLTPPTDELNSRIREDEFDQGTRLNGERARYALAQTTSIPTVWRFFKWYGRSELVIYGGDVNFVKWFKQIGFGSRSSYNFNSNSIEGGIGVFGSASVIRHSVFLKKKP